MLMNARNAHLRETLEKFKRELADNGESVEAQLLWEHALALHRARRAVQKNTVVRIGGYASRRHNRENTDV